MNRREFCASMGVAAVGSAIPRAVRRDHATPPGVITRRTYDDLLVGDLTTAHDEGLALVGRAVDSEGMRIAVTDTAGRIRASRRLTPPEGMDGPAVPAITRTADGYAVSSGDWVGMLAPDLTVEAKTRRPRGNDLGDTRMLAADPGVVVAHEYNAPNAVLVTVIGYDMDGNYQWHRQYGGAETPHTLGFLVSDPNGVIIGGDNFGTRGLWTAGLTPDGGQRWSATNPSVTTEYGPAAMYDDGLTVFNGTTLTKFDERRSVVWERNYESFSGLFPQLVSLPDGGMLAGTGTTVGAFGPDGRLRWLREYEVADADHLNGLLVLRDGEYVAAGSGSVAPGSVDAKFGWVLRLSSTVTPAASPTPSPTTTGTSTTIDTPTMTTGRTAADTSMPGFGPVPAFAALAGIAVWLLRRADS